MFYFAIKKDLNYLWALKATPGRLRPAKGLTSAGGNIADGREQASGNPLVNRLNETPYIVYLSVALPADGRGGSRQTCPL